MAIVIKLLQEQNCLHLCLPVFYELTDILDLLILK